MLGTGKCGIKRGFKQDHRNSDSVKNPKMDTRANPTKSGLFARGKVKKTGGR